MASLTIEHALLGFVYKRPTHGCEIYQQLSAPTGLWQVWRLKQSLLYALLTKIELQLATCPTWLVNLRQQPPQWRHIPSWLRFTSFEPANWSRLWPGSPPANRRCWLLSKPNKSFKRNPIVNRKDSYAPALSQASLASRQPGYAGLYTDRGSFAG